MHLYPSSLAALIEALRKLPGIGPKTAQRLALYLLHAPEGEAEGLAQAILDARKKDFFSALSAEISQMQTPVNCAGMKNGTGLCSVLWNGPGI